jgi:hypothetical protein
MANPENPTISVESINFQAGIEDATLEGLTRLVVPVGWGRNPHNSLLPHHGEGALRFATQVATALQFGENGNSGLIVCSTDVELRNDGYRFDPRDRNQSLREAAGLQLKEAVRVATANGASKDIVRTSLGTLAEAWEGLQEDPRKIAILGSKKHLDAIKAATGQDNVSAIVVPRRLVSQSYRAAFRRYHRDALDFSVSH